MTWEVCPHVQGGRVPWRFRRYDDMMRWWQGRCGFEMSLFTVLCQYLQRWEKTMMTVVICPHFQWQWECQSKLELTDWLTQKLCWCRPLLSALPWERQKDEWEIREGNKEVLLLVKWSSSSGDDWTLISRHKYECNFHCFEFDILRLIHTFLPELNFILQLL